MTTPRGFDEIRNFFSSYFHEDWAQEAEDPAQIISLFLAQEWKSEELRALAAQIRRFVDRHPDDQELERALFAELGSYYQPSADKVSPRKWLQEVASTLDAAATQTRS